MADDPTNRVTEALLTDDAIRGYLQKGIGLVVGLNESGLVQLQLPAGCNYIVLSAEQAEGLAELLGKWAAKSREALG